MTRDFTLTLKVARRQSGLSQEDCAHLINTHRTKISRLERGETPNIVDICKLAMIYGKPLESLCSEIFREIRQELKTQVDSLPQYQEKRSDRFNRSTTITVLASRLEALEQYDHGSA